MPAAMMGGQDATAGNKDRAAYHDPYRAVVDRSLCCAQSRGRVCGGERILQDKTITFTIGSAAGGGYDTYSRLVASHLGRHLEGQPTIVAQNMPGAGSIRAANYLYNVARKDGTAIGMLDEAIYLNQMLGTPELKADSTRFNWIGRILANSAVLFARRSASVQKIDDLFERELIVSTSGTASRLNWTVLKNTLGMKFTLISGYPGTNEGLSGNVARRGGRAEHALVDLAGQGGAQHPRGRDPPPAPDRSRKRRRTCRTSRA